MHRRHALILGLLGASLFGGGAHFHARAADAARGYSAEKFALSLGGVFAGWLKVVDGGTVVPIAPLGPTNLQRKYVADLHYSDFRVTAGAGMSDGFYRWIQQCVAGSPARMDGALTLVDASGKAQQVRSFTSALITEVGFPTVDAASKEAAVITVAFSPETIRAAAGSNTPPGTAVARKAALVSNFHLTIDGLDTTKASKVLGITARQVVDGNSAGAARAYRQEAGSASFSNLVVTLPETAMPAFQAWLVQTTTGKSGPNKNGKLEYLAQDQKTTLYALSFQNLKLIKLSQEAASASEAVHRITAEMAFQSLKFDYNPVGSN